MKIHGTASTAGTWNAQNDAASSSGGKYDVPGLPRSGCSVGYETLSAMMSLDVSQTSEKMMRLLDKEAKQNQLDALRQQSDAMRDKARDMRAEGLVAGAITAAAGAVSIGGAVAGPSPTAQANQTAFDAATKSPDATVGTYAAASSYRAYVAAQEQTSKLLTTTGSTASSLASPIAKATFGAAQANDDAAASEAAARAKFWENASADYSAILHEVQGSADRIRQTLQGIEQEKTATMHAVARGM